MKPEDTSLVEQISSEEYNDEEKQLKSIVSEGMMNPTMCYASKNKSPNFLYLLSTTWHGSQFNILPPQQESYEEI